MVYLMTRASNDGWEDGPGSVVPSEASLAHTGSIVDNQSGNLFVAHVDCSKPLTQTTENFLEDEEVPFVPTKGYRLFHCVVQLKYHPATLGLPAWLPASVSHVHRAPYKAPMHP